MARNPSTRLGDSVFAAEAGCARLAPGVELKVTTRAAVACSSQRRLIISFITPGLLSDAGGTLYRAYDAQIGSTAAEIVCEFHFDLLFGRIRIARQQGGGLHDHAVNAVAALHGLLFDEGLLDGVRTLVRTHPFE